MLQRSLPTLKTKSRLMSPRLPLPNHGLQRASRPRPRNKRQPRCNLQQGNSLSCSRPPSSCLRKRNRRFGRRESLRKSLRQMMSSPPCRQPPSNRLLLENCLLQRKRSLKRACMLQPRRLPLPKSRLPPAKKNQMSLNRRHRSSLGRLCKSLFQSNHHCKARARASRRSPRTQKTLLPCPLRPNGKGYSLAACPSLHQHTLKLTSRRQGRGLLLPLCANSSHPIPSP